MRYYIALFSILFILHIFAQTEKADSLRVLPGKTLDFNTLSPLPRVQEPKVFIPLYFMESSSAVNKYSMGFRKFEETSLPNRPADQLKLLYTQYEKEQEYKLFYSILGGIQTSAAAYMAYEHIKKHGLFK